MHLLHTFWQRIVENFIPQESTLSGHGIVVGCYETGENSDKTVKLSESGQQLNSHLGGRLLELMKMYVAWGTCRCTEKHFHIAITIKGRILTSFFLSKTIQVKYMCRWECSYIFGNFALKFQIRYNIEDENSHLHLLVALAWAPTIYPQHYQHSPSLK